MHIACMYYIATLKQPAIKIKWCGITFNGSSIAAVRGQQHNADNSSKLKHCSIVLFEVDYILLKFLDRWRRLTLHLIADVYIETIIGCYLFYTTSLHSQFILMRFYS